VKRPPTVSDPARICRVPTHMTTTPTPPRRVVEATERDDIPVIVFRTFPRSRATPSPKTVSSRASPW
jgi:hypothetical protein